jgi:phage portal protein BeeE
VLSLRPDTDAISALLPRREMLWQRINEATFLTDAEKREALGYGSGKKRRV